MTATRRVSISTTGFEKQLRWDNFGSKEIRKKIEGGQKENGGKKFVIQKKFIPQCPFGKNGKSGFPESVTPREKRKFRRKSFFDRPNETKQNPKVRFLCNPTRNKTGQKREEEKNCLHNQIKIRSQFWRYHYKYNDTTIQRYNDTTIRRYDVDTNVGSVPRSTRHLKVSLKPGIIEILKKLFAIRNSLTEEILEIEISSFEKMFILWLSVNLSTTELHLKPKEFQQKHSFQNSRWIFTIGRVSCSQTKNNFFA